MIAADVEIVFIGVGSVEDAGLEVVAARWGEGRVGGRVGGVGRSESEGEG